MMTPVNRLLAALPPAELERLQGDLDEVELRRGQTLWSIGDPVTHVYFPESGAVALVARAADGCQLETALVGTQGVAGLEAFFDLPTGWQQSLVMLPGQALRLPAEVLAVRCTPGTALYDVVRRYACLRLVTAAQSAVCDATHPIRHRCVRRLLALHDCARTDHFPLTQQMLAMLLGVRRASVSVAAERLQAAGLIVYEHGRMHVADRPGLERAACGCYQAAKEQAEAVFEGAPRRQAPEGSPV